VKGPLWVVGLAVAVLAGIGRLAAAEEAAEREILATEREAMEGWRRGDPDPLLRTLDPQITYIHVVTNGRLEGVAAVKALLDTYRGRPLFDSYEIVEPRVQGSGDTYVLTYRCVTRNGTVTRRWNATQIYRRTQGAWRVLHTHWSALPPAPAASSAEACGSARPALDAIKSAEGLVISPDGTLYFSQPFASEQPTSLGRYRPPYDKGPDARWLDLGGNALGITLDPKRQVLYAGSRTLGKLLRVTLAEPPVVTALADVEPDINGVTLGEDAAVYYSDQKGGHLYRVAPDGTKSRVTAEPPLTQPNGVAFGADGRLYVVSWTTNEVTALTLRDGSEASRAVFATLPEARADGIAFDAAGNAHVTARGVLYRLSADGRTVDSLGPSNGANVEFGAGALSCGDIYVAGNGKGVLRHESQARGKDVPWHRP